MNAEPDVTLEEVRHMARLSRLTITEEECVMFARQFGKILEHMNILQKIDTANIAPLYNPITQQEETRADNAINLRTHQEILSNAPVTDGEYFIVPRIV